MKIKMLCSVAAPGEFLARGIEYDLDDKRATEMLNAKFAMPSPSLKKKPEKALKHRN